MFSEVICLYFSLRNTLLTGLGCIIVYTAALTIYRLFFSPLAGFPGSRLAAATGWYETYYQLVKGGGGKFTFKIAEWHGQYGPIIRITPHEIHISDPEYISTIYPNTKSIDKPSYFSHQFGTPGSLFGTPQHSLHRQRKTAIQPLFSKQRVLSQLPQIKKHADKLRKRLSQEYVGTGQVLNLGDMLSCFAGDVIVKYAFDRCFDYLDAKDFRNPYSASFEGLKGFAHLMIQFPWLPRVLSKLPGEVSLFLQPDLGPVIEYRNNMTAQINDIKQARDQSSNNRAKGTIFNEILDSDIPSSEKTTTRLAEEAAGIVGGGIDTTKWAAAVTCFHIINNPLVLERLRKELKIAFPNSYDATELSQLENLPYLMACVEEGLRLSYGSVTRSPRIHRDKALVYGNYIIPSGTPVSTDAWHAHHDESVFPDSFSFVPERWLDNPKSPDGKKNLSRYTLYFGKGTRVCLGMHLVYAELPIVIAMLFRSFEFELFETDREDVDCYFDQIAPGVKPGSKGVRAIVKSAVF